MSVKDEEQQDEQQQDEQKDTPGAADDGGAAESNGVDEETVVDAETDVNQTEEETNWEEVARSRYEQLVRLQADFDNFRRRMDRERDEIQGRVAERLLSDLLPVFDNLERALQYMPTEGEAKAWRVGLEMTLNGFLEALARLGVKPIQALGSHFDPRFHEAVQRVDSVEPEGTVVEELQRGFLWNERVLRASLVKVSTGEGTPAESPQA